MYAEHALDGRIKSRTKKLRANNVLPMLVLMAAEGTVQQIQVSQNYKCRSIYQNGAPKRVSI